MIHKILPLVLLCACTPMTAYDFQAQNDEWAERYYAQKGPCEASGGSMMILRDSSNNSKLVDAPPRFGERFYCVR